MVHARPFGVRPHSCLDEEPQWHGALFVTAIAWAYVERYRPARRVGAWPVHQRRRTATTCSSWSDAVEDLVGLFGLPARPLPKITCRLAPALHGAAVGPRRAVALELPLERREADPEVGSRLVDPDAPGDVHEDVGRPEREPCVP